MGPLWFRVWKSVAAVPADTFWPRPLSVGGVRVSSLVQMAMLTVFSVDCAVWTCEASSVSCCST